MAKPKKEKIISLNTDISCGSQDCERRDQVNYAVTNQCCSYHALISVCIHLLLIFKFRHIKLRSPLRVISLRHVGEKGGALVLGLFTRPLVRPKQTTGTTNRFSSCYVKILDSQPTGEKSFLKRLVNVDPFVYLQKTMSNRFNLNHDGTRECYQGSCSRLAVLPIELPGAATPLLLATVRERI